MMQNTNQASISKLRILIMIIARTFGARLAAQNLTGVPICIICRGR